MAIAADIVHLRAAFGAAGEAAERFWERMHAARDILITSHINPDGDAVGSLLGLTHLLGALGIDARAALADPVPEHLRFLPGAERVVGRERSAGGRGAPRRPRPLGPRSTRPDRRVGRAG